MITKVITGITIPALAALILWLTAAPTWMWIVLAVLVLVDVAIVARAARIDSTKAGGH
jgi:hypothetical protein